MSQWYYIEYDMKFFITNYFVFFSYNYISSLIYFFFLDEEKTNAYRIIIRKDIIKVTFHLELINIECKTFLSRNTYWPWKKKKKIFRYKLCYVQENLIEFWNTSNNKIFDITFIRILKKTLSLLHQLNDLMCDDKHRIYRKEKSPKTTKLVLTGWLFWICSWWGQIV